MTRHAKPENGKAVALPTGAKLFSSLHREIDHLFDDVRKGFDDITTLPMQPAIDMTETATELRISAELPGLTAKDVDVHVEDGALVISGEKSSSKEDAGDNYRFSERSYGVFSRSIGLPRGVDASQVKASMDKGVLKITVARPPAAEQQRIPVTAG